MRSVKVVALLFLTAVVCAGFCYILVFGSALQQNENHFRIVLALPKVMLIPNAIAPIDGKTYLARRSGAFIEEMGRQGFSYTDQLGAGYVFEKDGQAYTASSRKYSSYFSVFTHPMAAKNDNVRLINI